MIGLLFGIITLTALARESIARWDRATQTWARSAEILISKHDISTLDAVTEFLRREYPSVQVGIQDRSSSGQILWSYPQGGLNFSSQQRGLLGRSIPLSGDSGLTAEIHVSWIDVAQIVLWTGGIVLALVALAVFAISSIFRYCVNRVVSEVDRLKEGSESEVQELTDLVVARENAEKQRAAAEGQAALGRMAVQVAHDIDSPLVALQTLEKSLSELPSNKRTILQFAVKRIGDIANDLLIRSENGINLLGSDINSSGPHIAESRSVQSLVKILSPLLVEKRLQFQSRNIDFVIEGEGVGEVFSMVQPIEFQRIISNLINNAVHASTESGRVELLIEVTPDHNQIAIRDNGKGIPKDILPRLMVRGETHGKVGGKGLGLFYAKERIEAWGGQLSILSEVGEGTTVTVTLPRTVSGDDTKAAVDQKLSTPIFYDAVLIDNDRMIHLAWKLSAEINGKLVRIFETVDDFLDVSPSISPLSIIYVDSQLNGILGEFASKEIFERGFKTIYISTGQKKNSFDLKKLFWIKDILNKAPVWNV